MDNRATDDRAACWSSSFEASESVDEQSGGGIYGGSFDFWSFPQLLRLWFLDSPGLAVEMMQRRGASGFDRFGQSLAVRYARMS